MATAKATVPLIGRWKLTHCKSSRPELPHPTAGSAEFIEQEDGLRYINESVWSSGQTTKSSALFHLDGNWYPVTGALLHDSISGQYGPDGSFQIEMRKGNADVGVCHGRVSPETGLLTVHWELFLPGGAVTWESISERQSLN